MINVWDVIKTYALKLQDNIMDLKNAQQRRAENRTFALGKAAILSISADSAVFFSRSKERPARGDLHAY